MFFKKSTFAAQCDAIYKCMYVYFCIFIYSHASHYTGARWADNFSIAFSTCGIFRTF